MAFRLFRLLTTLALVLGAAWLVASGLSEAKTVFSTEAPKAELLLPVLKGIGALMLLALAMYFFWTESPVRRNLENIFAIPELLGKLAFTLALLCIYRIGFHVPLPGLDQLALAEWIKGVEGTWGQALQTANMFTGGNLGQSTLFGLGIMPYISASIVIQLMMSVVPALERLQKEGPSGYKKIQEYTRYLAVVLCLVQASVWMGQMHAGRLLYPEYRGSVTITVMGVLGLTAGTIFLMWLGEQIDEYGIGNGISLLIMAGIVTRMPYAITELAAQVEPDITGSAGGIGPMSVVVLATMFVFVVAGAILITRAQRRIPIQQAKHMRGRRVYGGQRQYLPLRVNHGGVLPIIFAQSLMILPGLVFGWISGRWPSEFWREVHAAFQPGAFSYSISSIALIFFFAYFWTTVQFRPKEVAEQLRDRGSFIPGLRPGKRTADYLEQVMERITYCGAAFLALIAVIPTVVNQGMRIPYRISAFLGGTGLLIVVSVALDVVQRIEANLVMRNYKGFLGEKD